MRTDFHVLRYASMLAPLLLAGCLGGGTSEPQQRYYAIAPASVEATAPASADGPHIVLDAVDARGIYAERSLLYRAAADAAPLEQYSYASWAEPPDVMLQDLMMSALRGAFGATQVLAPGQRGPWSIRVSVRLHAMEQIRDGSSARAHFAATFTALDRNGAVLFVLDFDREAPASGASPLEYVNALSGLVDDADREVVDRLREVAAKASSPGA